MPISAGLMQRHWIQDCIQNYQKLPARKKQGKDVIVTSIYKYIDGGEDILTKVMEGLGIHKKDITG